MVSNAQKRGGGAVSRWAECSPCKGDIELSLWVGWRYHEKDTINQCRSQMIPRMQVQAGRICKRCHGRVNTCIVGHLSEWPTITRLRRTSSSFSQFQCIKWRTTLMITRHDEIESTTPESTLENEQQGIKAPPPNSKPMHEFCPDGELPSTCEYAQDTPPTHP